jgi:hypothetical protein
MFSKNNDDTTIRRQGRVVVVVVVRCIVVFPAGVLLRTRDDGLTITLRPKI